MRKPERRDWLALVAPLIGTSVVTLGALRDKGVLPAILVCLIVGGFSIWLWRRQIIRYPEDTWRLRL